MESVGRVKKAIITFLVLNFGLSSIFWYILGLAGDVSAGGSLYVGLLMWCPAAAAIITSLIFYRSIRDFGWRPGKVKYLIAAYAIPIIYSVVAYGLYWFLSSGSFTGKVPSNIILLVIVGTLTCALTALGEEIGWRGFLVPQMAKITSFTKLGLITGVIWAVWHYPLILFANYNAGVPLWYSLPMFMVTVIGMSFILAWFRLRSGSVWPPVLLHASSNLYVQSIFDPLTVQTGITRYIVGETGILVGVIILIFAFILWMQRDKLPDTLIKTDQENNISNTS